MANGYKDTSASGTKVTIIAVPSLPAGLTITEFPADTNPVDTDEQEIASYKMGANGDLIVSGTPAPVTVNTFVEERTSPFFHEGVHRIIEIDVHGLL